MTSVHDPLDNRIFYYECLTLARAGYDVTLIAPGDCDQVVDSVRIRSIPKAKRRLQRMTRTMRDVYRAAVQENANIYHFHDPELIPVGLLLRFRGKVVIYDAHEDISRDLITKRWIPQPLRRPIAWLADKASRQAGEVFSAIITATPSISRAFPPRKTTVLHNYPLLGELTAGRGGDFSQRPNHVVYLGSISKIRGVREMVEAMTVPALPHDAKLILAGSFDDMSLEAEARRMPGSSRVEFLSWQPRPALKAILESARVGLVVFHPEAPHLEALPAKLFEYMAAGIPVVASDFPIWQKIIGEHQCGVLVDPLDATAIGSAIAWLLNRPQEAEAMGRRGRLAVVSRYNWETQAEALLKVYEKLCCSTETPRPS